MSELVQTDYGILHSAGNGGSTLPSTLPDDTQATVWALKDDLCQKAATLARLRGLPGLSSIEFFCVPDAELEKLGSDERRITRLNTKLQTVNALLLAEGQSSVRNPQAQLAPPGQAQLAPQGPSEMPVRSTPTFANPQQKRKYYNLNCYMQIYDELTSGSSSSGPEAPARSDEPFGPLDLSNHCWTSTRTCYKTCKKTTDIFGGIVKHRIQHNLDPRSICGRGPSISFVILAGRLLHTRCGKSLKLRIRIWIKDAAAER